MNIRLNYNYHTSYSHYSHFCYCFACLWVILSIRLVWFVCLFRVTYKWIDPLTKTQQVIKENCKHFKWLSGGNIEIIYYFMSWMILLHFCMKRNSENVKKLCLHPFSCYESRNVFTQGNNRQIKQLKRDFCYSTYYHKTVWNKTKQKNNCEIIKRTLWMIVVKIVIQK